MQNLGIFSNHSERMKTFSPILISLRLKRCCYQAFSGHMPAMIYAQMHFSGQSVRILSIFVLWYKIHCDEKPDEIYPEIVF